MNGEPRKKTHVLLAEDDKNLGNLLCDYLQAKGFEVSLASNGKTAFDLFCKHSFDLCILDVMMPVKDGYTLAKEIRKISSRIPIVFLTAKSMKEDVLEGFQSGADDYINKPFDMEELLFRLHAILRRTSSSSEIQEEKTLFEIGLFRFDYPRQLLILKGKEQKLTTKEADLLRLLCMNMHDVLDRNFALNAIWKNDNYFAGRSMDVYITKLRKYLKEDPRIELLNIHGRGFRLTVSK